MSLLANNEEDPYAAWFFGQKNNINAQALIQEWGSMLKETFSLILEER
ncbi:MAG: hypothetical protein HZB76_02350 [Chlamydiae bacterium]|nr:hypothetical protein [Chlamydiota bacterium]